ncbi:MAG: RpiB/LacA/LacB family sugar-phosphate isomerase [Chloroflexota bacterium]
MRIGLAADHAGAPLKAELLGRLADEGYDLVDLGGDGSDPTDDYPDHARLLGHAVRDGAVERGILVCGSGDGRAAVCHDTYSARQGVEHDDVNILCLGGRVIGVDLADACARAFLDATFSGKARHARRVHKIAAIEAEEQARRTT